MIELSRYLRKPTEDASRIICTLKPKVVRTFAAKARKLKKLPRAKAKASKKEAPIEEDVSSKNLYPFYIDKGHRTLPSSPITISPDKARIQKDDSRFYNVQDGKEICTFPSVSRVLACTKPLSFTFAIQRWEENVTKELGKKGAQKLKMKIRTRGHNFHKAVGDYLVNMQPSRIEDTNKACSKIANESMNKDVNEPENVSKDVNEIQQHPLSFQDKLRETLRGLSQRLTGLFISVMPSEKKAVSSSKLGTKQVKQAVAQQTSKLATNQVATPASKQVKQDEGSDPKQVVSDDTGGQQQLNDMLLGMLPEGGGLAKSVEHVVNDISEVYAVESMVSHMDLGYVGTVDVVAKYKDEVCVIDWKTSQKPKKKLKDIHDFPQQAIAYAGAINSDKNYTFNVEKAAIVVVYFSGEPADVHMFDKEQCLKVWAKWLDRLEQYHKQFASDLNDVVDEY